MSKPEKRNYKERKEKDPEWARKMSERVSQTRRNTKRKLLEHFGSSCIICGYDKCVEALEFHHPDPDVKENKVIGTTSSFVRQLEEAKKCLLVCSNCHREIHSSMLGYHK